VLGKARLRGDLGGGAARSWWPHRPVKRGSRVSRLGSRTRTYRRGQLDRLSNVQIFLDNRLGGRRYVLGLGMSRVVIATARAGARMGRAVTIHGPIPIAADAEVLTPDDLMGGRLPRGKRVLVWDDDHYYMGGVLAEMLADRGYDTLYLTPASEASTWTAGTLRTALHSDAPACKKACASKRFVRFRRSGRPRSSPRASSPESPKPCRPTPVCWSRPACPRTAWRSRSRGNVRAGRARLEEVAVIGDALAPATMRMPTYAGRRYCRGNVTCYPRRTACRPFRREIYRALAALRLAETVRTGSILPLCHPRWP